MVVARTKVRIGVFIPADVQLFDLACIDFFAMMSHDYLTLLKMLPASLTDLAPEVLISYIGTAAAATTTAQTTIATTHLIGDSDVAPGKLDIVLVPGPDPFTKFGEDVKEWLRKHGEHQGVDVLCVCTGIFLVGDAGLLKGKTVCGPRGLQGQIREKYEGVKTVGEKYRWVQDGRLWTSGEFLML
jgi:transcriptional regulator GlxA family with amidase domain